MEENNIENEVENIENEINEINEEMDLIETEEQNIAGTDSIKISNEAVATYAGIAVSEVQGVYAMVGGFSLGSKKNYTKGIKVEAGEKNTKIDVNIIVDYGVRIPEVAFEIQTRVKNSVEAMTGLKVLEVNVHIQGVHPKSNKDEEKEEVE
jgi:uncharacterized alkaline shock family protein YloU